jgi:hypothetical protein
MLCHLYATWLSIDPLEQELGQLGFDGGARAEADSPEESGYLLSVDASQNKGRQNEAGTS